MKTYSFSVTIRSSKEQIWKILWDDATYRIWAAAFHEGTHAISDWKVGSRIMFVDEKGNGAFAEIIKNNPNEIMSFNHLGWTGNWQELPADMEFNIGGKIVKWSGGIENYMLSPTNGETTVTVEMIGDFGDWDDHINNVYPKALENLRKLCEQ